MPDASATRASLLIRLRDRSDCVAWAQFVEIYSPLIYNFARRCRFQDAEAADVVQDVMGDVFKAIERFEYNPQLGKFRSWLYKIAKRKIWRLREKNTKSCQGTGDTASIECLANIADETNDLLNIWDQEYQQYLLRWASNQIKGQFTENTWRAFWMTAVEEKSIDDAARELKLSTGAIYIARSRVIKRLGQKIREVDDSQ